MTLSNVTALTELVPSQVLVPLRDGRLVHPINLDHAASTPAMRPVQQKVDEFLHWYSSVHRGAGFNSQLSTHIYEQARAELGRFVGARANQHVVIFGANTTWALNKLARRLAFKPGDVVISTELEHHANDLPWRQAARVVTARCDSRGRLDVGHVIELLRLHAGRVRLLAVTGGSNVTGHMPDIHALAELAHAAGAEIAVDCAQLAPHRPIDIGDLNDPAHLDYIVLSGHKIYAPYGGGALIGRRETFAQGAPDTCGGGTVRRVTPDAIEWADAPARDEAGTPNVAGAVALAAATAVFQRIGFDAITAHETELTAYALERLREIPRLQIFGETDPARANERLGVIPFRIDGVDHRLTAAILSHEYGIAVRAGAFCAHHYVRRLLGPDSDAGCATDSVEGLVRISFGLANTIADIDTLIDALQAISRGTHTRDYEMADGGYRPRGWAPDFDSIFSFEYAAR